MDKEARNAIERATQQARTLLEDDFASQLAGTFDVLRDGRVAPAPGSHLSPREAFQREKIVAAIEHKQAAGMSPTDAVMDYVRDAAFTTLNRFVALKMLETRQLLQECITKGEQSSGFREFCGLAAGVALLPDGAGYRLYIESLFDELSTEVKVLFDRRDTASALWPRRATFEQLLNVLNSATISSVWGEDETIGWVYQFFNSGDERRRMREESQAPRNSRELAIRNQFFTPRYVVEFLVDNTLGRTWLEMFGDASSLMGQCRYFVRSDTDRPSRPTKDPRDIRVLDPACGSGHFLLYCFDLLLTIYQEAWATEASAVCSRDSGRTLRADYPDSASLRRAMPALILEHNLFGVDIDPRATQIAALALWLRAQRAWKDLGVPAPERPPVRRAHVVVAEPMPGDATLVDTFASQLDPPLLRDLFQKMVAEMRLAGELGTLIKVEEGIASELHRARALFVRERHATGFFPGMEPVRRQADLDLSGIDDERFFHKAEARILQALQQFSQVAAGSASVRRRLFADDATQGIALIELLRTRFDVVLMNPPFGQATPRSYEVLRRTYHGAHSDIYACFVRRGVELAPEGLVGAITSRSFMLSPRLESFRERTVIPGIALLADLGLGVMDSAFVESAAYVLASDTSDAFVALDCRQGRSVDPGRLSASNWVRSARTVSRHGIMSLPQRKLLYLLEDEVSRTLRTGHTFEPSVGTAREGMKSFQNDRFLRLAWEVPVASIGRRAKWFWFAKGGSHAFYYAPIHLLLRWHDTGRELCAVNEALNGSTAQVRQASRYWFRPGATYSKRSSKGFSARVLPADVIFSSNGPAVLSETAVQDIVILGWLNSLPTRALIHLQSSAADYSTGSIKRLPWPEDLASRTTVLHERTLSTLKSMLSADAQSETSAYFVLPWLALPHIERAGDVHRTLEHLHHSVDAIRASWDSVVAEAYGWKSTAWMQAILSMSEDGGDEDVPKSAPEDDGEDSDDAPGSVTSETLAEDLISWCVGVAFGRFDVRLANGLRAAPGQPDPFGAVPVCAPGMLTGEDGLPLPRPPAGYPVVFPETGVLVDDPGHPQDLSAAVRAVLETGFGSASERLWEEIAVLLAARSHDIRPWLGGSFFERHIRRYSKSHRKAPIYWQLGVASGRYSVWLYAHRLTRDSFFQLQNEIVGPKLALEERHLTTLRESASGSPSAPERRATATQEALVEELRAMLEEIKRIAPLWNPNLDDGVVLTMAPLWRLVPQHKPWQKELKGRWDDLAAGKYDWAHVAMHLWPERVIPKCVTDRSLAIAHGLEDALWVEGADGKWQSRTTPPKPVEELVRDRTSPAVKAALKSLLEAPSTSGQARGGRRSSRNPASTAGSN